MVKNEFIRLLVSNISCLYQRFKDEMIPGMGMKYRSIIEIASSARFDENSNASISLQIFVLPIKWFSHDWTALQSIIPMCTVYLIIVTSYHTGHTHLKSKARQLTFTYHI